MEVVVRISLLAIILATVIFLSHARIVSVRVPPSLGCVYGRKDGLFRHRHVSACKGRWRGHVEDAQLCSPGWHVCSWNDSKILSTITWYEATHTEGCYAINAAQNDGGCKACVSEEDDLAGIGADCPRQSSASPSCLGTGRIDASCCSATVGLGRCSYLAYMSGVLCCQDEPQGSSPIIATSPEATVRVPTGTQVSLHCQATGEPLPQITWYRNGYPLESGGAEVNVNNDGKVASSSMVIGGVASKHEGLYLCRAKNKYGFAVSYTSELTVVHPTPKGLVACRDPTKQQILHGGNLAACSGKWKGTVKKAKKQLCAKRWHVCGLKDRKLLHELSWDEVTSLAGCYAYDAATSNIFACNRCSRRNKGNSMSGMGSGCGGVSRAQVSCLSQGRIDVWNRGIAANRNSSNPFDVMATGVSSKSKSSCRYKAGITTGVMCCKDQKKKRKGKNCKKPCGANSHCNRRGKCKCDSGFKSLGKKCIARKTKSKGKGRRCAGVKCLNAGRCRRGKCICQPRFSGPRCETVAYTDVDALH